MMNVPDIYGSMVFNDMTMKQRLTKETYKALKKCIAQNESLPRDVANVIANSMKDWAVEKGATHFTHWFQPMTGITAEKHDSFMTPLDNINRQYACTLAVCILAIDAPFHPFGRR